MTGQTVERRRARSTRPTATPREPIFRFKKRALVHFAVDPDEVYMTTRLEGKATRFLPFNRGNGTAAGNPPNPDGYKTAYLWEQVWARDSLHGHPRPLPPPAGRGEEARRQDGRKRETMIFPRYHQLDCVRKLRGRRARKAAPAATT